MSETVIIAKHIANQNLASTTLGVLAQSYLRDDDGKDGDVFFS